MSTSRPTIVPISTHSMGPHPTSDHAQAFRSHSQALLSKNRLESLPSPPLSPQQDHGFGRRPMSVGEIRPAITISGPNDLTSALLQPIETQSFPSLSTTFLPLHPSYPSQHLSSAPSSPTSPTLTPSMVEQVSSFDTQFGPGQDLDLTSDNEAIDPTVPMLPSQLRKRHESMRRSVQKTPAKASSVASAAAPPLPRSSQEVDEGFMTSQQLTDPHDDASDGPQDQGTLHLQSTNHWLAAPPPPTMTSTSGMNTLTRAKSYSSFERTIHPTESFLTASQRIAAAIPQPYAAMSFMAESRAMPATGKDTRDWVKMQSKINSLETEVSHATRANMLLNQELDKVNGHLTKLTSEEGEGWRREYEFLVQQVDIMHRQLQLAQSQASLRAQQGAEQGQWITTTTTSSSSGSMEVACQLDAEVKDLTDSLRMWQSAFQQAEEKYRRKCDGERVLKQTLQEREAQLSSLVNKLSSYETEFRKSVANYEELLRLSSELDQVQGQEDRLLQSSTDATVGAPRSSVLSPLLLAAAENASLPQSTMPGHFPVESREDASKRSLAAGINQYSVSILSWTALLATFMFSS